MINLLTQTTPFALIKRRAESKVLYLSGPVTELDTLAEIKRAQTGQATGAETFASLSILPYRQVEELGFVANHKDEKILSLNVENQHWFGWEELVGLLPNEPVEQETNGAFSPDDAAFTQMVETIIRDEIGEGEGCNFVVPRRFRSQFKAFDRAKALSIFRRMLANEYGTYWTYLYFTGEQYFIGATPERHLSVKNRQVKMNPISGTFRKLQHGPETVLPALESFLKDPKEIFELLMVTDEELKMMAELCARGGQVVGPMLKEMSKLIHTEYVLVGESDRDPVDMLRESMFAATVVGGPVENACRVIARHDPETRRYYGSALALFGADENGGETLDSPITIRTVEIDKGGAFQITVGATLVRNSIPASETEETHAKVAGVLAALQTETMADQNHQRLGVALFDEDVQLCLSSRGARLSRFWIEDQSAARISDDRLIGKSAILIDNEDNFIRMLAYIIRAQGMTARIVKHSAFDPDKDKADLIVLGPGPGDPRNLKDPKMARGHDLAKLFLERQQPLLCVCLGHQILCDTVGFPLGKKARPYQGTQELVDLWGSKEWVGFYNTFAGKRDGNDRGFDVSFDPENQEIHAIRKPGIVGLQFHPESILTTNGARLVRDVLRYLLNA